MPVFVCVGAVPCFLRHLKAVSLTVLLLESLSSCTCAQMHKQHTHLTQSTPESSPFC